MVLLLILGGVSVYSITDIVDTNRWVNHTRVVLADSSAIVASAVDMETGMRGYLLAGQEDFLDPYRSGREATYRDIKALRETVKDNPAQVERLQEAETVLREWQADVTEPTIALRREIGDAKTMNDMAKLVGEARGKQYFDKFRDQIATFIRREATFLSERRGEFQTAQGTVIENIGLIQDTTGRVDHTYEVLATVAQLLADAVNMETGMRGYLLAGEESFLDPYNTGKTAFFEDMQALREMVYDNPAQVERLQETETIIRDWVEKVSEPAIALRRAVSTGERRLQDIEALISRQEGKKYFDSFRAQIAAFSQVERNLMAERQETAAGAGKKVSVDLQVMNQNEEWVTHTYDVIARTNSIMAAAVDMETGMRGYLLAGREDFLAPYTDGAKRFYELVANLSETVNDNPAQVQLLKEVEQTIREWRSTVTEPAIALRREIGDAKTMDDMADLIGEARGKQYFDRFRQIMTEFRAEETGLMEARQAINESTVSTTFSIIGVCVAGALIIGLMLAWLIGNAIANPIRNMTEAMKNLAGGDSIVNIPGADRGDEIGEMGTAFNEMARRLQDTMVSKDELTEEVAERKRIELELIQAAKMATLGEMATGMAHELNQPLNVIRMAADNTLERVEKGDFDTEYLRGKLERISAQTERAAAIIDHMRIFGRAVDKEPRAIDLREVTRDALGLIGEQIRLRGIQVETDLPEVCRPVMGHRVQLEQVVLNLLGNARDAIEANRQGPEEPRKITVTVEDTGPEDNNVRLIVEDSGGGIPQNIVARIFEPFFTTKEIGKGTGLGLSISYGIVTDMGGTIKVANAGDGARITITLPVVAEQTSAVSRSEAR